MKNATATERTCPACHQAVLAEAVREKCFHPQGKTVTVTLRVSRCPACGTEMINAEQRRENLQRLRERKVEYGPLLLGEEIVALRKKYGLTQQATARIFGKGLIAFSRYENEASYPDLSTTKLLKQAMARPELLKALADEEGVEIPLWEARCENERREKRVDLRVIERDAVPGADWEALRTRPIRPQHRWASKSVPAQVKSTVLQVFSPAENDESYAEAS
jgi:putative zinc finger/helix-turn-helix YgiT family protein